MIGVSCKLYELIHVFTHLVRHLESLASQGIVVNAHALVNFTANRIAVSAQLLSSIHVEKERLFSTEIFNYLRNYQNTDASSR